MSVSYTADAVSPHQVILALHPVKLVISGRLAGLMQIAHDGMCFLVGAPPGGGLKKFITCIGIVTRYSSMMTMRPDVGCAEVWEQKEETIMTVEETMAGTCEEKGLSRRSFLGGSALALAGAVTTALVGCSGSENVQRGEGQAATSNNVVWDDETDIIVVGAGGAGLSAGITVATEGLGECILFEAAPEERMGGNTRVSGQCVFIPKSVEGAIEYQTNLNGPYEVEPELVRAWAENICENLDWLTDLGLELEKTSAYSPEWPDVPGCDDAQVYLVEGVMSHMILWDRLKEVADDYELDIRCDSRVRDLVFDPVTKEVFGVKVEVSGSETFVKARKGVVLACGGFENDAELMKTYQTIGYPHNIPFGTPYNRGDGIRMAQRIGAKLWHMNSFAMSGYAIRPCTEGEDADAGGVLYLDTHDYLFVGSDAKRFAYEEAVSIGRHGKDLVGGASVTEGTISPAFLIIGQGAFDSRLICFDEYPDGWPACFPDFFCTTNQALVDAGLMAKGETIEELAEQLGLNPTVLANTVKTYNDHAAVGEDPDFGRGTPVYGGFDTSQGATDGDAATPTIEAFDLVALEGPYYGIPIGSGIINTQGGPKRDVAGNIVDVDENPIPRLYGAGEFGTIYSYSYNGGGNVSEALSSGRLAARSVGALESWDVAGTRA